MKSPKSSSERPEEEETLPKLILIPSMLEAEEEGGWLNDED
jgi:hypothetical protein